MKKILAILFCLTLFACNDDDEKLIDIYSDIRESKQINSISLTGDKKLRAISKLRNLNNENTPDTLEHLFYQIDTTIIGHYKYQFEILEVLAHIYTEKSLKIYSKLIGNYPLNMPGNMFFIWDMRDNTEKAKYLFPELAKALENQKWIDDEVLSIIINGYKNGHLTKNDLLTSKQYLVNFYNRLIIERDSLPGCKYYDSFYSNHLSELIICLSIFDNDPKLNSIYNEALNDNLSFSDYHNTDGRGDYHNNSRPKLEIIRQALLALIKNNQEVESIHIEKLIKDPLYRLIFYKDLRKLNKNSLFPKKYLTQKNFAESDLVTVMESIHDEGMPSNLKFLQQRTISNGKQKGNYYFFQTSYLHYDTLIYEVIPSGPQPLNKEDFIENGKWTNKYIGTANSNNIDMKIDDFIMEIKKK